jgi:outer membrane protein insertion porin family
MLEPTPGRKGDKLVRDMLVSLKEGNAGSIEVSLGYGDYEQLRGSIDISYRNLGGYNRRVGLRGEMSSVERRYIFNFREPWLFNKPNLPFKVFLIKEDKRVVNIDTKEVLYKIDRLALLTGVEKELTHRLRVNLNYEYSFVDTKDVKPGVILSKEDTGTLAIGSISPSLFYDTRDNPFDPTSGSLNSVVLKFASKPFLSETEFIKGTFQSSWFFQLKKGIIFALSFRGGAAYSFKGTKELPLIERFFLGGRTTVRGYSQDTLGPKGADDTPTGGNIFALVNGEFRFSLGRGFGIVTFIDGGNVWKTAKEVEPVLKYTAGAGLRYSTPVGPIRIDYGYKLKRQIGESAGEIHFSFGHAF